MGKYLKLILCAVLIVGIAFGVYRCTNPYKTETVAYYEYQKAISGQGYILRSETIVTNDVPGTFEPFVNEGDRVSRNAKIGTVISGKPDEKLIEELGSVKERIEDIEKSNSIAGIYQSDTMRIANAVKADVKNLRAAVTDGDLSRATELKKEIGYLKSRTAQIENNESGQLLLSELYDRKKTIEDAIGTSQQEVCSPISGVYSSTIDGLEKYGSEDELAKLLPDDVEAFDQLTEAYDKNSNEICKITDSFTWYLASVITSEEAEDVNPGNSVTIKFDDVGSGEIQGKVYSLSEIKDGKQVMVISSNLFVEGISGARKVSYEVILQKKTGLRIPSSALRIEDGKKGVYILIDKKKSFRYVNNDPFRSDDDEFYIVDRKYSPAGASSEYVPLKENDKVLINPEDVR